MTDNKKIRLLSYLSVRQTIGFLAILLPIALVCYSLLCGMPIENSISDYYYTNFGDVFVGILCGIAVFLFTYKGYEPNDVLITNIASVTALCVAFFPTNGYIDCGHFMVSKR